LWDRAALCGSNTREYFILGCVGETLVFTDNIKIHVDYEHKRYKCAEDENELAQERIK
jgi:hypothetical protein